MAIGRERLNAAHRRATPSESQALIDVKAELREVEQRRAALYRRQAEIVEQIEQAVDLHRNPLV